MTEPNLTLGPDETMNSGEMRAAHDADRPDCDRPGWQVGPPGFRCTGCGWFLKIED